MFIIYNRNNVKRFIELLDQNKGIFCVYGESYYLNRSETMLDFEGGPSLHLNSDFYGTGAITALSTKPIDGIESDEATGLIVYLSVKFNKKTLKKLKDGKEILTAEKPNEMTERDMYNVIFNLRSNK